MCHISIFNVICNKGHSGRMIQKWFHLHLERKKKIHLNINLFFFSNLKSMCHKMPIKTGFIRGSFCHSSINAKTDGLCVWSLSGSPVSFSFLKRYFFTHCFCLWDFLKYSQQTSSSHGYLEIPQRQCQVQKKKEKRENLFICSAHLSRVFSGSSPGLRRRLGSSRTRPQSQRRKRSRAAPSGSLWTSPCPLSPSESHFAARCLQCPGCTWPPCSRWCVHLCNHAPLPSPLC